MIKVEQNTVFDNYKKVAEFQTEKECIIFCNKIIKRIIRKNIKAEKDWRPNAYGKQNVPFFKIGNKIYGGENMEFVTPSSYGITINRLIK
jgi:hypothetical protein